MTARILTVDPGLDAAGLAIWHAPSVADFDRALAQARLPWLAWTGKLVTDAGDALPARCHRLAAELRVLARDQGVTHALVEIPATHGVYAERAGRQRGRTGINARSMAGFHAALGALFVALHDCAVPVTTVPASRQPKPHRHTLTKALLAGGKWSRVKNGDVLCAIHLGLMADVGPIEGRVAA